MINIPPLYSIINDLEGLEYSFPLLAYHVFNRIYTKFSTWYHNFVLLATLKDHKNAVEIM